uniref:Uncharacterized protein n=1 Tax=Arundo donax TaxID=35708 RepID=A0A0A9FU54_ARUDO
MHTKTSNHHVPFYQLIQFYIPWSFNNTETKL